MTIGKAGSLSLVVGDGDPSKGVRSAAQDTRFWARTRVEGDCLVWTGYRDKQGYGTVLRVAISRNPILAHRYAWMLLNGPIAEGEVIRHSCDNPPCVKGEHLLSGTQQDNIDDRQARGRHRPGRLLGEAHPAHRLTERSVLAMRELYTEGAPTKAIAEAFGVSQHTAYLAISGKSWTHLGNVVQMRGRGRPKAA